jgi:hypothetical protein
MEAVMPRDRSPHRLAAIPLTIVLVVAAGTTAAAQTLDGQTPSAGAAATSQSPTEPTNPWSTRPVCASMFLKSDWQLTPKQRACDWLQNGVLSTGRLFTTMFATGFSMAIDTSSEDGDSFKVRFGRKWVQGAFATTGEYLGGLIAGEDARQAPPYLAMRRAPPPHGFIKRVGSALSANVITTQCVNQCRDEGDIHRRFGFSRVLGAVASGAGGVAVDWNRPERGERAWHGMVSAYASSFGHALFTEFKPEVTAFGGRVFRLLGVH